MLNRLDDLRLKLRDWLGFSQFQRSTRNRLNVLEAKMVISEEDMGRMNAATTRIAARVASLLDLVDALGTGNDDQVRAEAALASTLQASVELRPLVEQLEALAADPAAPVPTPEPGQVPVEPGPDVSPVGGGTAPDPAPTPPVFDESGIAPGTDPGSFGRGNG